MAAVASAALEGRISAADAASMAQIVESYRRLVETAENERLISQLEAQLAEP